MMYKIKEKVIIYFILLCSVLVSLIGCSASVKRQDNISDGMYKYGEAVIEIVEDYFSGKLTSDEAATKLNRNVILQESLYNSEIKEYGNNTLVGTEVWRDGDVYFNSYDVYRALRDKSFGTGTDESVRDAYNDLKKVLWE